MPRRYPPEFRRKVLDLVAAGRPVAQVAPDLVISAQVICTWRRQHRIDSGQVPGITSSDQAELVAARKRIAELETELAIHLQATELLVPPKRRFEAIAVMATGFGGPGADHHLGGDHAVAALPGPAAAHAVPGRCAGKRPARA